MIGLQITRVKFDEKSFKCNEITVLLCGSNHNKWLTVNNFVSLERNFTPLNRNLLLLKR